MRLKSMFARALGSAALVLIFAAPAAAEEKAPKPEAHDNGLRNCLVVPGSIHCHPRHGFSAHTHWDRKHWAHPTPGYSSGAYYGHGGAYYGHPAPWPLSNVDIEVPHEK